MAKYWWVNHKQTFRQEFFGKYIWSPKRKRDGTVNPFYETMREVRLATSFIHSRPARFKALAWHGHTVIIGLHHDALLSDETIRSAINVIMRRADSIISS